MSKITIFKKNIIDFETDCIVNAANEFLAYGGGVCGVIFRAAGVNELSKACNEIGHCNTGDAVITPSFGLRNNKYIIHAVGPVYSSNNIQNCRNELYSAYYRSLEVMLSNGCHSITFPLISSGIYGYPVEEAWKVAINACRKYITDNTSEDIQIYFATIDDYTCNLGNRILTE